MFKLSRLTYLIIFFLLHVAFSGAAQTVTVLDKTTWQPLAGVTVAALREGKGIYTDENGKADLAVLGASTDSVRFSFVGYQQRSVSLAWLKAQQYQVGLAQRSQSIEEVVVTAGKFTQQRQLVPQQVTVLKAKEIGFMSQPTTADLLQQTGEVLVQKSQLGGGSPVVRGFEANKVLLVVDGVRMNNAIYRGGHLQNVITLDNSMLERVEIVQGPGSVIYGSDALGGVLHFRTLQPQLADSSHRSNFRAGAYARYGTAASEKTVHAQFNYGRRKWGLLTGFTRTDLGDLRQGENRPAKYGELGIRNYYAARIGNRDTMLLNEDSAVQRPTGYTQYDLLQKVLFKASDNLSHGLNLQYSTSSDIPRYDRLTETGSNGKLKHAQWYYGPQERLLAAYTLTHTDTTTLYDAARVVLAYQQLEESRHNRGFGSNSLAHRTEDVDVYSLSADFSKQLAQHRLSYGLEAIYNNVQSAAFAENMVTGVRRAISTRYPDGGSSMQSAAAFVTNSWQARPSLVLTQGLRYSWVGLNARFRDKQFFPFLQDAVRQRNGALTGSVGAVLLPGHNWRLAVLGASGFRAPSVDDLGKVFDSSPGNVIVPNPELAPEYTYTLELSVSKSFLDRVHLEATGYYTWYRDALVVRPFALNGQETVLYDGQPSQVMAHVNAGSAFLYGYNASLAADLSNALALTSTLNYTYGRVKEATGDVPLDHIPPLYGKTSLTLQLKKLRAELYALYNGPKHLSDYSASGEDNLQYATPSGMPGWHTFNLRTAYQLSPHLQLQAALENITDRYYRVFASGISAPGRNFVLTLRAKI
ncbi:TonB-dependent receptor [Botryobacter ruber]|uniref:TonB-dependent receptor n=1 Tax=Botryobacter ruber TaxID=2171629 RepID=UPI000E0C6947|nr:TonB-dependent receptor [Botryobacter ruber]